MIPPHGGYPWWCERGEPEGAYVSVRDQERKEREADKKADQIENRIRERERQADKRADEVVRRIEKGDVTPRELPGKGEDSIGSIGSIESIGSMDSMESS